MRLSSFSRSKRCCLKRSTKLCCTCNWHGRYVRGTQFLVVEDEYAVIANADNFDTGGWRLICKDKVEVAQPMSGTSLLCTGENMKIHRPQSSSLRRSCSVKVEDLWEIEA